MVGPQVAIAYSRLGQVTRALMAQIMKLLDLAPDIQEQILFLPNLSRLNQRSLRPKPSVGSIETSSFDDAESGGLAATSHLWTGPARRRSRAASPPNYFFAVAEVAAALGVLLAAPFGAASKSVTSNRYPSSTSFNA